MANAVVLKIGVVDVVRDKVILQLGALIVYIVLGKKNCETVLNLLQNILFVSHSASVSLHKELLILALDDDILLNWSFRSNRGDIAKVARPIGPNIPIKQLS
jgi:hypothetical protein